MPNQPGQVTLQVQTERQEVGNDDDPSDALSGQPSGSFFQAGLAQFQKGGFDVLVASGARKVGGYRTNGLIGRLNPGTVGKDDNASDHEVLMYARM